MSALCLPHGLLLPRRRQVLPRRKSGGLLQALSQMRFPKLMRAGSGGMTQGGILTPAAGGGPVTFGAISQSTIDETGDGSHTVGHTAVTGSNVAAVAFVFQQAATDPASSGVNYGGSAPMTQVGADLAVGFDNMMVSAYVLANPPTGLQTVTSTLSSSDIIRHAFVMMSYTNVNQSTPAGALFTATGAATPASVTVTSVGANDLVVDFVAVVTPNDVVVGAGQTPRGTQGTDGGGHFWDQSTEAGSGSVAMTWVVTGVDGWGSIAFRLIAA
jgi:hypothetical protein